MVVSRSSGLTKTILQKNSERGRKTRQTEEEVGRQHQGMDRPGVCQILEGIENRGKWRKLVCEIIRSAPTTLMVKKLMMMTTMTLRGKHSGQSPDFHAE